MTGTGRYIGAIDQGTTSSRFMVFDRAGRTIAMAQREHRQIFPQAGWVEHDPDEILASVRAVIEEALRGASLTPSDLAAVGITNQRETTVLWDRRTGRPVHNALVWQDTRVEPLVAEMARDGGQDRFRDRTGLPLASYFSALKLRWLLDNVPGADIAARCRRSGVRNDRRVVDVASDRAACHRRNQREPHATDEFGDAGLGRYVAGRIRHSPCGAAARSSRHRRSMASPPECWRAFR